MKSEIVILKIMEVQLEIMRLQEEKAAIVVIFK